MDNIIPLRLAPPPAPPGPVAHHYGYACRVACCPSGRPYVAWESGRSKVTAAADGVVLYGLTTLPRAPAVDAFLKLLALAVAVRATLAAGVTDPAALATDLADLC